VADGATAGVTAVASTRHPKILAPLRRQRTSRISPFSPISEDDELTLGMLSRPELEAQHSTRPEGVAEFLGPKRPLGSETAPRIAAQKSLISKGLVMRLNGVEPSRVFPPTRPSTLRVYQFRHSRSSAVDSRCLAPAGVAAGWEASCGGVPGLRASGSGGTLRTGVRMSVYAVLPMRRNSGWTWT
jgi:hypothetical protein